MRKLSILLFSLFAFVHFAAAQSMSDEQIMQYVMEQQMAGKSQQEIASELVKKGVSISQLQALKSKYEKQQQAGSSLSSTNLNNVIRSRDVGDDPQERMKKGSASANSLDIQYGMGGEDMLGVSENDVLEDMIQSLQIDKINEVFGRSMFNNRKLTFEPNLNIATPENYRLGPGDEVLIDIWGASQTTIDETISPDGYIQVISYGPLYLNGKTVAEANEYAKKELSKIYAGIADGSSQLSLTLGQLRSIQINVMGEVRIPGSYTLSSLASVFHALYMAGGVNDIGTLRTVKVYRNNELISTIDIYDYIINGNMDGNVRLMDGDVIVVGPYDSLVKVAGKVKRPMIYEMKNEENVGTLLEYAGGFTGDAYTKNVRLIRKSGREYQIYTVDDTDFGAFRVMDGDSLFVDSVLTRYANLVEVRGAVYRPGMYQMGGDVNTIKELIDKAEGIRGDAFLNRAVLHRYKDDLTLEVLSIDAKGLLDGTVPDMALHKDDILYIPSIHDVQEDRTVSITGEVAREDTFAYGENMTLEDIILQAGGLKEAASTVRVDVSRRIKDSKALNDTDTIAQTFSFALKDGFVVDGEPGFVLQPFDEVHVRRSPGYQEQQNIEIEGEIMFAGTYTLSTKTQRVSDVIARAGGVTNNAYVKGARLERRMTEDERRRMQSALRTLQMQRGNESLSEEDLNLGDTYFVGMDLEKALDHPGSEEDIVLREGDKIIIPQYTNTVKINGAVMHPTTISYLDNKKLKSYVDRAGGYAYRANKKRAYVIYMNGTIDRLKSRSRKAVQPGCEIIIPYKQARGNFGVAEIVSLSSASASLATMAATLVGLFGK